MESIMERVHMAWNGCIIGNPSEAGKSVTFFVEEIMLDKNYVCINYH